jgi:hypothetical protein
VADKVIQLSVKVNSDTGALEVLGAKFQGVSEKAKQAQGSFSGLKGEAAGLLKQFLPFATTGGIIAFFSNAVLKSNEHAEAMRRLKGDVDAAGLSFDKNKDQIVRWSEAIQAATRFDNDQAISSLERFVRATGNLATAMRASKLAMDISVQTGKNLQESEQLLIDLIAGNERGLKMANKELGAFTGGARTAQSAIDNLQRTLGGAAEKEQSFTKEASQTKAAFDDFSRTIGDALGPAVAFVMRQFTNLLKVVESLGSSIAGVFAAMFEGFKGFAAGMLAVTTGHFSQAKVIALDTAKNIEGVFQKTSEDMDHIWESQTDKQIAEALKASNGRIAVSVQGAEAMHDKLAEIEAEIQQKMAALGEETFAKKRLMDQAEIAAERAKIEKEFKDEVDKNGRIVKVNQDRQKALDKLGQLAVKQDQERTRQEVKIKTQGALDIVDLSLQTLNILNSMGDNSTKAEVARARVILALEKAIAIGRIWTAASSGNVAVDVGMKIAGTALVVAQFAQQSKAIGEAASRANAGTGSIGAGGSEDAGGPGSGVSGISGGAPGVGGGPATEVIGGGFGGGGGGGGSGTTVINVGGVVVQFSADHVDLSDIDVVGQKLAEYVRSGVVGGVALAVVMKNVGDRNAARAV